MEIENNYLPIKLLNPKKIVIYERWITNSCSEDEPLDEPEETLYRRICLLTEDENRYHKYCGFNKFTKETFSLPSKNVGWTTTFEEIKNESDIDNKKRLKREKKMIKERICDPESQIFNPELVNKINVPQNCEIYKTLDNYDIGFIVYVGKNETHVYGITNDVIIDNYDDESILFTNKIVEYEPLEIFIGKSPINKMTKFSGGYGDKWDGNSILLRIGTRNEFRYVHIGTRIYEFVISEQITKYVSSVGNNCVPYPYAESQNFCYCMSDNLKTPISDHPNREKYGNVSYIENATYYNMEIVIVSKRGSYNARYQQSPSEKTNYVRNV